MWFCTLFLFASIVLTSLLSTAKGEAKPCDFPQFKNGRLYYEERRRPYFPVPIGQKYSYYCDSGFLTTSGSYWDYLHCTAQGWKPEVPCLKTCIKSDVEIENGFLSESVTQYLQNKTAQYMCEQGYVTADGKACGSITCLESGWSAQPLCFKSCDVPVFENSVTKNNSTWFKLNDEIDYECRVGYVNKFNKTKSFITCTYDGWSEKPSCHDSSKICGPPPPIENGDITSFPLPVYVSPSSVEYQCQYLYEMQGNKTIICINGEWSEPPKCLRMTCKPPDIPNGIYSPHKVTYTVEDEIEFECQDSSYSATQETVAKCTRTGWVPVPRCMKPCEFPQFNNGHLYYEERWRPYFPVPIGQKYSYYCDSGFLTPSGSHWDYLLCTEQGWEPEVPCLKQCVFRDVENGYSPYWSKKYVEKQAVKVQCYHGYSLPNGQDMIMCTENGWSPPPKCIKSCDVPVFENAGTKNDSSWFQLNDKINYECRVGFVNKYKQINGSITCNYNGWSDTPLCYDLTKICGPPPPIDNGDITSFPLPVYIPPASVEYQCQTLYLLYGNKTIICINGEWSEPPKCLNPCIISTEIMEKHNITFRWKENQKQYYQSGEMQEFKCKNGHHLATSQPLNTMCINGYINYPTCTK